MARFVRQRFSITSQWATIVGLLATLADTTCNRPTETNQRVKGNAMSDIGDVVSVNGRKALLEDKFRDASGEWQYLIMFNLGESAWVQKLDRA